MAIYIKKSDYDPYLHSKFQVHVEPDHIVEVELFEITDTSGEHTEGFSLIFRGPLEKPFQQRIYQLQHPQMGALELFMVPVNYGKQDAIYYQALFNRLRE